MTEIDIENDPWVGSVPPHRQVETSRALIDEDIADLLEAVWRAGIDTSHSCQGGQAADFEGYRWRDDDVRAYILFPTVDDALSFMHRSATQLGWSDTLIVMDDLEMALAAPLNELHNHDNDDETLPLFDSDHRIRATVRWPIEYTYALTNAWKENPA